MSGIVDYEVVLACHAPPAPSSYPAADLGPDHRLSQARVAAGRAVLEAGRRLRAALGIADGDPIPDEGRLEVMYHQSDAPKEKKSAIDEWWGAKEDYESAGVAVSQAAAARRDALWRWEWASLMIRVRGERVVDVPGLVDLLDRSERYAESLKIGDAQSQALLAESAAILALCGQVRGCIGGMS